MTNAGTAIAQAVAASYDFSQFKTIVDVGGAQDSLVSTIMRWLRLAEGNVPHLKGILFDLPEVIANVSVNDKIQPVAGNFLSLCHRAVMVT